MKRLLNMGPTDRIVRGLFAIALVIVYVAGTSVDAWEANSLWAIIILVAAAILLLTAVVGFCPLYAPFRFTTRKQNKD